MKIVNEIVTAWKVSKYGGFLVCILLYSVRTVFSHSEFINDACQSPKCATAVSLLKTHKYDAGSYLVHVVPYIVHMGICWYHEILLDFHELFCNSPMSYSKRESLTRALQNFAGLLLIDSTEILFLEGFSYTSE